MKKGAFVPLDNIPQPGSKKQGQDKGSYMSPNGPTQAPPDLGEMAIAKKMPGGMPDVREGKIQIGGFKPKKGCK